MRPNDPETTSVFDEVSLCAAGFGLFLFSHLELRSNLNILDLGCGTGFPLFELAQVHGASCQVTGVDVWKQGVEPARLKGAISQCSNVRILEADAAQLPFEDTIFDLIVSNLGVNNFSDPDAVFAECFRIVLTTNLMGHMSEFYAIFHQVLLELQISAFLERLQVHEARRGTKEALSGRLQTAGFRLSKMREGRFHLRYLDGSAFFDHWLTKVGFLDDWRQIVDPEEEVRVFALLEARLNQMARASGELRLTVPMLYLEAEKSTVSSPNCVADIVGGKFADKKDQECPQPRRW
ncbi:MAG: class I SAM-dependent methyltransferase [Ktedonobacteraceae bacterium]|nr:class I SAM-dependent methyltransferase [Ktedonobacteraceae bacterium]